ncbi:3-hydroxyacyl-ACP dehydratase FabZ [Anthocerotibacter panamensis]|uniref:3-hydroxyacyl-ACP dehydratase FabZ n=1 Tax=Anthocerotibacter panamensis TaxID=2857077 RepID=UPI001C407FE8|nr:3-hydroxyacyl-ACP dehydratase FabZ [Anthocerotibacter panamensis]
MNISPITLTSEPKVIFDTEAIKKILPHRYPFLFLDGILEYVPYQYAIGIKNVSVNEYFFVGHFPDKPLFPAVLLLEAVGQVGVFLVLKSFEDKRLAVFTGSDKTKFRKPIIPGDQIVMRAELLDLRGNRFGKVAGRAEVNGELVGEAILNFALVEPSSL